MNVNRIIGSSTGAPHARLYGVGARRASTIVSNDEIGARLGVTDKWIRVRSGIEERRWAAPGETVMDMAVGAGAQALEHAQINAEQIDLVVVATISHLRQTPAAATDVAHRLGTRNAPAFDISAACAGFCYGLAMANDAIRGGTARYVLVIGAERFTDMMDLDDPSAFLFGDGAGAAVVGPSDWPGIGPIAWGSDGSRQDMIQQVRPWDEICLEPDVTKRRAALHMDGTQVYRWATRDMVKVLLDAVGLAAMTLDDLDVFIPHQANMRIIDAMAKQLGLPDHVTVARDIVRQGNTSAASVPLAMAALLDSGAAHSGDAALLAGFGAGLSYGAQVVILPSTSRP